MSEESRATTTTTTTTSRYAAPTDLIPARLAKSETRAKARAKHIEFSLADGCEALPCTD
jgi:hypothetical protein